MAKKKVKKNKIDFGDPVEVTWEDSTGFGAWSSLHEDPPEPVVVHQLGYFLGKTKRVVHIASGLPEQDCQALNLSAIPTGCVTSIKKVKL
jgi:hypothetical protein